MERLPAEPRARCAALLPNPFEGGQRSVKIENSLSSPVAVRLVLAQALHSEGRVWRFSAGEPGHFAGTTKYQWQELVGRERASVAASLGVKPLDSRGTAVRSHLAPAFQLVLVAAQALVLE